MNDEMQNNGLPGNEAKNNETKDNKIPNDGLQNDGIQNNETKNNEVKNQEAQEDAKKDIGKGEKPKMTVLLLQVVIIVCLIAGGLWLVCGKSWKESTAGNGTEHITEDTGHSDRTEEDSLGDTEEEVPEESEQDVTVISVLGKEELVIENDRIQKTSLKMIDNMFTLEEINTILSAIKGTWEAEQAVGMISYNDYEEHYLPEVTMAEGQRQYYEIIEHMEQDTLPLPDFTISIQERNTSEGGIVDMENNYIYVRTKDGVNYDSPMSVVLGVAPSQNLQRLFGDESLAIYIQFFFICDAEEEGSAVTGRYAPDSMIPYMCQEKNGRSYEPATLILTPEGAFELYKDGIFYSLKPTIQSEIMSGNFEHLEEGKEERGDGITYSEYFTERYPYWKESCEWRQLDLNGDGIEDLILHYISSGYGNTQGILGIFACDKDSAHCIMWDDVDSTEYYFCGSSGELMYTAPSYGMYTDFEPYRHCHYDRDWNLIKDYDLIIYRVDIEGYMEAYPQHAEEWIQANPDMAESGVYFLRRTDTGEELLTQEEFTDIWESVTGLTLESDFLQ